MLGADSGSAARLFRGRSLAAGVVERLVCGRKLAHFCKIREVVRPLLS